VIIICQASTFLSWIKSPGSIFTNHTKPFMRLYKKQILLFLTSSCFYHFSFAQENKAQIKGYVFNPKGEPALYSTVILMNPDSVSMKGTLALTDGLFLLENINPGKYLIMVRNVEFETYVSEPISVLNNEIITLDKINLKTKVTGLDEVVVTGSKAMVEVHSIINRNEIVNSLLKTVLKPLFSILCFFIIKFGLINYKISVSKFGIKGKVYFHIYLKKIHRCVKSKKNCAL